MRNAFAKVVTDLAKQNPDIILLAGDIGNRLFDNYKEQNSVRFYNCGVAEAGMTGIAAWSCIMRSPANYIHNNTI